MSQHSGSFCAYCNYPAGKAVDADGDPICGPCKAQVDEGNPIKKCAAVKPWSYPTTRTKKEPTDETADAGGDAVADQTGDRTVGEEGTAPASDAAPEGGGDRPVDDGTTTAVAFDKAAADAAELDDRRKRSHIAAGLCAIAEKLNKLAFDILTGDVPHTAVVICIDSPVVNEPDPQDPMKMRVRPTGETFYRVEHRQRVDFTTGEIIEP